MSVETPPRVMAVEDEIREWMRAYHKTQGIPQVEYARRLGIPQSVLSCFIGTPVTRRFSLTIARAVAAYHPELRPLIHRWVAGQQ